MPRPAQTTENLNLSGALKHDPKRYENRKVEVPDTKLLGTYDYPKWYSKEMRILWKEILAMNPPGVLVKQDQLVVERLVPLVYKMRHDDLSPVDGAQLITCLAKLGMTPADRLKVRVCDVKYAKAATQSSPFAAFIAQLPVDKHEIGLEA